VHRGYKGEESLEFKFVLEAEGCEANHVLYNRTSALVGISMLVATIAETINAVYEEPCKSRARGAESACHSHPCHLAPVIYIHDIADSINIAIGMIVRSNTTVG
jgi:hypothetical protein